MKSYISAIVLMNRCEERIVPLKQGVNIITGDSKTGKSALIEIIDYCLCSSTSTIPKGIITEFTELYCITLIIKKTCYVVARQSNFKTGKMYFSREPENFDPTNLDWSYFNDKIMHSI
ncbi:MAG: AAA family ATPase, partial [Anaerovoracaceae bacterium]